MTTVLFVILFLWLAGLTWYVIRLALAPVPAQDIQQAVHLMATNVRHAIRRSEGRDAVQRRLVERAKSSGVRS